MSYVICLICNLRIVLRFWQHIKEILHHFVAVYVRRPDQDISVLMDHIGKTGVIIKGQAETVGDIVYLIFFDQISSGAVLQFHSHKQVKYIDTGHTTDMRFNFIQYFLYVHIRFCICGKTAPVGGDTG